MDVLKEYSLREGFQVYTAQNGQDLHTILLTKHIIKKKGSGTYI